MIQRIAVSLNNPSSLCGVTLNGTEHAREICVRVRTAKAPQLLLPRIANPKLLACIFCLNAATALEGFEQTLYTCVMSIPSQRKETACWSK